MIIKPIFIIEHLEPKLYEWCIIEYGSISEITGKNQLWFTNIKEKNAGKLRKYGKVITKSVKTLNLKNSCILDPDARKTLTQKIAKKFNYFILGGILGDHPPQKRTKKELTRFIKNAKSYNIGKSQFSTDNAVFVVNEILKGKFLSRMKFKNDIEIKINDIESVILPYSYPVIDGKPLISERLIRYIKNKKSF